MPTHSVFTFVVFVTGLLLLLSASARAAPTNDNSKQQPPQATSTGATDDIRARARAARASAQREKKPTTPTSSSPPSSSPTPASRSSSSSSSSSENNLLHPDLRQYDLTRGGEQHASVAQINNLHQAVIRANELFQAARESGARDQLHQVNDKMVPELQENIANVCGAIYKEVDESDHKSMMLRDKVKELNQQIAATRAAADRGDLLETLQSAATGLRDSEELFARATSVKFVCMKTTSMLEQLAFEVKYTLEDFVGSPQADL